MARQPRLIVPGYPHHVVQRGNRNQRVFLCKGDQRRYLSFLRNQSRRRGFAVWAYCLMSNHVHLIAVPEKTESLTIGIGETHRRYTWMINQREGWRGYLWQGRFFSRVLNERYLYAAVRYVERNPVRAGLVKRAEDYPWSSARAHVAKTPDRLLSGSFLEKEIADWSAYVNLREDDDCDFREFHAQVEES